MGTEIEPKAIINTAEGTNKFINQHRINTKSDLIEITEDKLENILLKHLDKIKIRSQWLVPFSIFTSVFIAYLTSTFTTKFGIAAGTWEALYLLLSIGSGVWLAVMLLQVAALKEKGTISELLSVIKDADPRI